ncbi:MAG: OmpA family protein [Bdellovibrionales bacterium]|nr:OmpA family protein [Bdellovibrionales bacterium]
MERSFRKRVWYAGDAADAETEAFTVSFTSFSIILLAFFIFLDSISAPNEIRRTTVLDSLDTSFLTSRIDEQEKTSFGIAEAAEKAQFEVVRKDDSFVITMPGASLFESGDDSLKEEVIPILKDIAARVGEHELSVRIEGHTDDRPISTIRFRSNWELSAARAVSVLRLFREQGIPAERLSAAGRGEFVPAASNETPEGRAKNRRVVVVITAAEKQ